MRNRNLPRIEAQGADLEKDGYFAQLDWRYECLVDYLKLSNDYKLVCKLKGKVPASPPKDWKQVVSTYRDFGDVFTIKESDWWNRIGKRQFGIQARKSESFMVPNKDEAKPLSSKSISYVTNLWSEMAEPECLVLVIPKNQTKQQALKQIDKLVRSSEFISAKMLKTKPNYQLLRSKLQKSTVALGIDALKKYRSDVPLWKIAFELDLSIVHCRNIKSNIDVAESKRYLQVLASKLIHKAENIAENAARGKFPSDKALTSKGSRVNRPAGRPRTTK
jgi:hypothetical protein